LLAVGFEVGPWAPVEFPFREGSRVIGEADLPRLVAAIRSAAVPALGPGFDRP
jgi:hypothetical protein